MVEGLRCVVIWERERSAACLNLAPNPMNLVQQKLLVMLAGLAASASLAAQSYTFSTLAGNSSEDDQEGQVPILAVGF